MTPEVAVDLIRDALWLTAVIVGLVVLPSLVVGLIVAMFQAATQINEQTLSFVPRLLVMLLTLIWAGPWLVREADGVHPEPDPEHSLVDRLAGARLMLELSNEQIGAWVGSFLLPLFRIASLLMVMPIIGTQLVPVRVRLYLAMAIALVLVPTLPPMPVIDALTVRSLMLIAQEVLIGVMLGFTLQLFFICFPWRGRLLPCRLAWPLPR
jgi:flagellar biosynthesis protein FliQ